MVVPTGKMFPAGMPVRTTVTEPELSEAVGAPSSASVTTSDVVPAGAARVTFGGAVSAGAWLSVTVTVCVFVVALPKTSVAVHVIVVTPIAKRFPAGTPERVTMTPGTLSVAVAVPIVESLTNAVDLPASAVRVTFAGAVRVGGWLSGEFETYVPIVTARLSNERRTGPAERARCHRPRPLRSRRTSRARCRSGAP